MAHFRKIKAGWKVEIDRKGFRKSRTFPTKEEGRQWALGEEAALRELPAGKFPNKTLAEAMQRYAAEVSVTKAGQRFEELRLRAIARDFPALAAMPLTEVDTPHLGIWRDARLKTVSPGSIQREINLLRNVFSVARKEWKWCGHSPFVGLRMPGENPARERRIDWREVRRLCRWLNYRTGIVATKYQEVALAFLIGLRTGMRAGEIMALSDARVDLGKRVVTVPHKLQHLTKRPRKIPLTYAGARLISVLHGRDPYFTVSSESRDAIFRKAREGAGLDGFTFHDSRAEALTRLSKKVDVMTLSRISGHKDIQTLVDHYYRETAEDIAARLIRQPR